MARSKQTTKPVAKSPTTEKKQKVEKSGKPAVKKASINVAEKLAASEAEVANAVAKLVVDDKKAPAPETVSPYQLDKAQVKRADLQYGSEVLIIFFYAIDS